MKMKKTLSLLLASALSLSLLAGCGGMTSLLHSGDHNLMYAKALEFYEAGKWSRASTLFENIEHIYDGSPREDSIAFFNARCKYKSREWDAAAELLDRFRRKFGRSGFIEDAEGMYAMCFYYLSPGPTRDQTMTVRAPHGHSRVHLALPRERPHGGFPQNRRRAAAPPARQGLHQRLHLL